MSSNALAWGSRKLCCSAMTRECNLCRSGSIWSNLSGETAAADAPGSSESVSVVPPFCLWGNSGSSARTGLTHWWDVPPHSPSLTPHWEKSFSALGRACSLPSWPEAPTGWGAGAPGSDDRTTVLTRGPCSRKLRILMPTFHNGARAPTVTYVNKRRIKTWKQESFRSAAENQFWGWMYLKMWFCVNLLNGS